MTAGSRVARRHRSAHGAALVLGAVWLLVACELGPEPVAVGSACVEPAYHRFYRPCVEGAYCARGPGDRFDCRELLDEGADCSDAPPPCSQPEYECPEGLPGPCVEGLVCREGICQRPAPEGAPCEAGRSACAEGLACNAGAVPEDPAAGRCLPPSGVGGPCWWRPRRPLQRDWPYDFDWGGCAPGLYCAPLQPRVIPSEASADPDFVGCDFLVERADPDAPEPCLGLPGRCVPTASLEEGESCLHALSCRSRSCLVTEPPLGAPGAPGFPPADCSGWYCARFPWPGICVERGLGEPGAPCRRAEECLPTLACGEESECVPTFSEGEGARCTVRSLTPYVSSCRVGLHCDPLAEGEGNAPRCAPAGAGEEGASCTSLRDCRPGLGCDPERGACAPLGAEGEACGRWRSCRPGLRCAPSSRRCVPRGPVAGELDQPCGGDGDCAPNLYCDVASGRCAAAGLVGQRCGAGERPCQLGLRCEGEPSGTCVPLE